jgi:excisionase family DNA binding protein
MKESKSNINPLYIQQSAQNDYFNSENAFHYLSLPSRGALYQIVRRREIGFFKCGGRLRFHKSDLDKFQSRNYHPAITQGDASSEVSS